MRLSIIFDHIYTEFDSLYTLFNNYFQTASLTLQQQIEMQST